MDTKGAARIHLYCWCERANKSLVNVNRMQFQFQTGSVIYFLFEISILLYSMKHHWCLVSTIENRYRSGKTDHHDIREHLLSLTL